MKTGAIAVLLTAWAAPAAAQDSTITIRPGRAGGYERLQVRQLPRDVAEEVVRFFNGPGTIHFSGQTRIPSGRGIDGDVAILGGPVVVAGRISGGLLVINGDVEFEPSAVVGRDVLVVGGSIDGADDASIGGEIRAYRDPLRYRRMGEEIVYAPEREIRQPRWLRARDWREGRESEAGFLLALGGIYNRVEGLPIIFGPRMDIRLASDARLHAEAHAIFRTAGDLSLNSGDFGYRSKAELVLGGRESNLGLGVRGYDLVESVEPWVLKNYEVGWASFLLHRDYRDYYRRHGGSVFASLRVARTFTLTAEGREERHSSLEARDPWTLFRSADLWRANPTVSEGRYRAAVASVRIDTRNDRTTPTSGWYVNAEYELGEGRDLSNVPGTIWCIVEPCAPPPGYDDGRLTYQRVGFDVRSYTRISPAGRLNVRAGGAGWVGGDPLPIQRRVSLGYPDPLPGYEFRQFACGGEQFEGVPALCDRMLFGQVEFRTHLGLDFGPEWASDWGDDDDRYEPFHVSGPDLVVFADAGQAWTVGDRAGQVRSDRLPGLDAFKTDVGLGIDFGPLGLYLAKALDGSDRPVMFSVRMGRRF